MKKKIVIGNWKMNPLTEREAEKLFKSILKAIPYKLKAEVVICPPFIYLEKLKKLSRKINLGAQDAFWGEVGAFTGEISPEMLANLGVKYLILGHSERRALGETDSMINKKLKAAIASGLKPILCVGEEVRDEKHEYFNIVKNQIIECLRGIPKNLLPKIIIAYEPVWAIYSTPNRRDATPADSKEMAIFIRKVLSDLSSPSLAAATRVLYGGSA